MTRKLLTTGDLVLILHLRFGLASRTIENWLRLTRRGGKSAHLILQKYGLVGETLKGRLLGCSHEQAVSVLDGIYQAAAGGRPSLALLTKTIDALVPDGSLSMLADYRDRYVIASDPESFHRAVSGEVRNLTQQVFSSLKSIVGICQYRRCKRRRNPPARDTAHIGPSRPQLFQAHAVASSLQSPIPNAVVYDLYASMRAYLRCHMKSKNRVRFLCKKPCHSTLGSLQQSVSDVGLSTKERSRRKKQLKAYVSRID